MEFRRILANGIKTIFSKAERLEVAGVAARESGRTHEVALFTAARRNLLDQHAAYVKILAELNAGGLSVSEARRRIAREAASIHAGNDVFRTSLVLRALMQAKPAAGQADYAAAIKRLRANAVFKPLLARERAQLQAAWPEVAKLVRAAGPDLAAKRHDAPAVQKAIAELNRVYGAVYQRVEGRVDVQSEEILRQRTYGGGFFGPQDNPPELLAQAQEIIDALARGRRRPELQYHPAVITDATDPVGFTVGGSAVLLHGGLFKVPEAERAGVIAHELEHLEARHLRQVRVAGQVNAWFQEAAAKDAAAPAELKALLDLAVAHLQREHEYAADAAAMRMMQRAGYDPAAFVRFLQRFEDSGAAEALSDHPTFANRLRAARRVLSELRPG